MKSPASYRKIYKPEHPLAYKNGYISEHLLVVIEARKGKPLPTGAVIHHHNGDGTDNRHSNLVVCQDKSYHQRLHARMVARTRYGDPNKRKCPLCGRPDFPTNMVKNGTGGFVHSQCRHALYADKHPRSRRRGVDENRIQVYRRDMKNPESYSVKRAMALTPEEWRALRWYGRRFKLRGLAPLRTHALCDVVALWEGRAR